MKKLLIVAIPLLFAGCSQYHSAMKPSQVTTLQYQCNGNSLPVNLDNQKNTVSFIYNGKQVELPQATAASGTRYSNGEYEFWSKGKDAMLSINDKKVADCTEVK